ncbi:MAG: mandelate racemase/muconate lactonizing enzyme family protein [Bacteroidota bacterium]
MTSRRSFIKGVTVASCGTAFNACSDLKEFDHYQPTENLIQFKEIAAAPVLQTDKLPSSVIIDSIEIYKSGNHFFTKVTSKDGGIGISVNNKKYIESIYAIMINRVIPSFLNEDARKLDILIDNVYLKSLNYKWQGLAFWVSVAYVELAILDLLGQVAKKPIGDLLGGRVRDKVAIYYASGNRGNTPEEEIEYLQRLVQESGSKAVKYRLGARMHYNEASTKRDKALIPLVRKELGSDATIYVDANGSYDVKIAIEIGKILEDYKTDFFEEPCRFDHYEETKAVADALQIPIAGGETEVSTRQFMWLMEQSIFSIVQPDLLFYGGIIRSIKVARMAEAIGISCTPHISGKALGFLYMLQFASCVSNIGPYQEFKGNSDQVPIQSSNSSLQPLNGYIDIPKEPGLGVEYDPELFKNAEIIKPI